MESPGNTREGNKDIRGRRGKRRGRVRVVRRHGNLRFKTGRIVDGETRLGRHQKAEEGENSRENAKNEESNVDDADGRFL